MASILQFIPRKADFDDAETQILAEAFERACAQLHDRGQPDVWSAK